MKMTVYDTFFLNRFQNSLGFHLSTLRNAPLSKPFQKASVFIKVSGCFRVDDRRERIKKYAFSRENALVWLGRLRSTVKKTLQLRPLMPTMFGIRGFAYIQLTVFCVHDLHISA